MAKLTPFNIRARVYCTDEAQARQVQDAVQQITSGVNIVGGDLLGFYAKYKQNEGVIRPILSDVMRNGVTAISRHILTLRKIR